MPPVGFEPTISAGVRPAAAHLLKSWVRIPPWAWIFVCCECRVLSGIGLCDELITRPEESYRLCCVVVCDLETSRMGAPYIYDISHLRVKNSNSCGSFRLLSQSKYLLKATFPYNFWYVWSLSTVFLSFLDFYTRKLKVYTRTGSGVPEGAYRNSSTF